MKKRKYVFTLALMVGALVSSLPSQAQTSDAAITIVSHVDIIPDIVNAQSEEGAGKLIRAEAAATQKDAGLLSFTVLQQNDEPNHFTIVETWRDMKSYQQHQGANHSAVPRGN